MTVKALGKPAARSAGSIASRQDWSSSSTAIRSRQASWTSQERPSHAGGRQGESVAPVILRLRHAPGQSAAVLIGQAARAWVTDGYPPRTGNVEADCVDKGVGVAGGLEVDQSGIGWT